MVQLAVNLKLLLTCRVADMTTSRTCGCFTSSRFSSNESRSKSVERSCTCVYNPRDPRARLLECARGVADGIAGDARVQRQQPRRNLQRNEPDAQQADEASMRSAITSSVRLCSRIELRCSTCPRTTTRRSSLEGQRGCVRMRDVHAWTKNKTRSILLSTTARALSHLIQHHVREANAVAAIAQPARQALQQPASGGEQ